MALANVRIVGTNAADLLSFATPSPVLSTATPITNIQSGLRSRVIRTTSVADQTITGNWSTAATIGAVSICRHNLDTYCTWRVELFSAINQGGSTLYDSTATAIVSSSWDSNNAVLWLPSSVSALSFRLTIKTTNSAHPADGYFEIGRLYAGAVWTPTINATHDGWRSGWKDDSRQVRTGSGSLRSESGPVYREIDLSLDWISESERASLWELLRSAGLTKDLLVAGLPGADAAPDRDHLMLAKISEMPGFGWALPSYWNATLRLSET